MRDVIAGLHLALVLLLGSALGAQVADWPPLELEASEAKLELPNGWHLQEVAGVATTPAGNLLVFHRGLHQLLELRFARLELEWRPVGDLSTEWPRRIRKKPNNRQPMY